MATQRRRTGQNSRVSTNFTSATDKRTNKPGRSRSKPKPKAKEEAKPKPKKGDYISPFAGARDAYFQHAGRYQVPKDAPTKPEASEPPAPKPKPPAPKPADKVPSGSSKATSKQDKNYRGNLFEKTFGYKKGEAPDQLNKRANYAGADTGYTPSTKVDKNYADKKPVNQTPVSYGKDTKLANEPAKPASPPSPNQPKKYDKASQGMTLAERMRRRRLGLD